MVLEKTLESPLDCKEIQPVHSEGDQPWDFFGRKDAKAETPILWLPAPTHVFIGGSGGNLKEIIEAALSKNPRVRIVLNTVTAETFAEATAAIKALPLRNEEIVELNVSRGRKVGGYHLMTAQNPVYIISCEGAGEDA